MGNRNNSRRRAALGVTLVELLIVMAVLAILSSLAVSNYRRYVLRTNRTEGRMVLLAIQTAQEKFFLQNNAYAQDLATVRAPPPGGLGIGNITAAGVTLGGNYTISFQAVTPNTYRLQAVATGPQTQDTACLIFTVDDQGARTPSDSTGCWR
jgi:type IV pilus assembly protein PilE